MQYYEAHGKALTYLVQLLAGDGLNIGCRFADAKNVDDRVLEGCVEVSDLAEVEGDGGYVGGILGALDDLGGVAHGQLVVVLDGGVLQFN